jgi:hypothetical protein
MHFVTPTVFRPLNAVTSVKHAWFRRRASDGNRTITTKQAAIRYCATKSLENVINNIFAYENNMV